MILSLVLSRSSCDRLISARSLEPLIYRYIKDKRSSTGSCHYLHHRYLDKDTGFHLPSVLERKKFNSFLPPMKGRLDGGGLHRLFERLGKIL
jgi:hypothetical protein